MKLTVEELKWMYLESTDLVKIIDGGKTVYSGSCARIPWQYMGKSIKAVRPENEIRRKDWRETGLWPPMNPEAAAHIGLRDAEIRLYWVITLEGGKR